MSNVRQKNRSEHKFTILDKALDLYDHTTTVTANPMWEKVPSLADSINNEAALIYHCCRSANEDFDSRQKDEAEMRIKLEEKAIEHCKWLKTDIRLANGNSVMLISRLNAWYENLRKGYENEIYHQEV